jgi:hypothetical protein
MKSTKKKKRADFKCISLEQKWKDRTAPESYEGSKSGNRFLGVIKEYDGKARFS